MKTKLVRNVNRMSERQKDRPTDSLKDRQGANFGHFWPEIKIFFIFLEKNKKIMKKQVGAKNFLNFGAKN